MRGDALSDKESLDDNLFKAAAHNHMESCINMLYQGADVNATNHEGVTALAAAALSGNAEIVELLIRHGANMQLPFPGGHSPLVSSYLAGHHNVVKIFIEHGCTIDSCDGSESATYEMMLLTNIETHYQSALWCQKAFKPEPEYIRLTNDDEYMLKVIIANKFVDSKSSKEEIDDFFELYKNNHHNNPLKDPIFFKDVMNYIAMKEPVYFKSIESSALEPIGDASFVTDA
ncbi:MAG: ankyrin repeat domain-containing protein [Rickettsiaceae bacterium]|nr:ankyrin repeat domain-containing protein [Rickettsiaceae bacterium]